ncbi:hypothetical protein QC762_0044140 [Podospora pseudocomata]|uniref:Uncharacterized protein n=1 Tax=Podospora pseudocomata TaxID=2093779 RepID=A0ABR0GND8_9PEZI|nr:hypothetical protein QC762_0044140 [Podospora pseudocomata]
MKLRNTPGTGGTGTGTVGLQTKPPSNLRVLGIRPFRPSKHTARRPADPDCELANGEGFVVVDLAAAWATGQQSSVHPARPAIGPRDQEMWVSVRQRLQWKGGQRGDEGSAVTAIRCSGFQRQSRPDTDKATPRFRGPGSVEVSENIR